MLLYKFLFLALVSLFHIFGIKGMDTAVTVVKYKKHGSRTVKTREEFYREGTEAVKYIDFNKNQKRNRRNKSQVHYNPYLEKAKSKCTCSIFQQLLGVSCIGLGAALYYFVTYDYESNLVLS